MKKTSLALMIFFTVIGSFSFLESGAFAAWGKFDQGMAEAAKTGKPVIVDFYTDWCGWCKKMDAEVFSNKSVAARLEKEFVTVRINAESNEPLTYKGKKTTAVKFTGMMKVEGFPTLIVFGPNGDVMTVLPGYVDANTFMLFLDYIKNGSYKTKSFEAYYRANAGKR